MTCKDIVEFGCGYGHFTVAAARVISGKVHAIDIEPAMVAATRTRAQQAGLSNFRAEQRDFVSDGSGLPDRSVDYAMLFNILHIENPVALLRQALRVLAPGGKVGIIHWRYDPQTPRGPSMAIRPRPEDCARWGEEAGLELVRYELLSCCPYHYGLVMHRPQPR